MPVNACDEVTTRGTTLQRQNPDTLVWEEIAFVVAMPEPTITHETDQCNSDGYGPPEAGWKKKYKTGVIDGGTMSATLSWRSDQIQHRALREDTISIDNRRFRVQYPDPALTVMEFEACVTTHGRPSPPDGGKFTTSHTFDVSGAILETFS